MKYKLLVEEYQREIQAIKFFQADLNSKIAVRDGVVRILPTSKGNDLTFNLQLLEKLNQTIDFRLQEIAIRKENLHNLVLRAYDDCPFAEVRKMGIDGFYRLAGI